MDEILTQHHITNKRNGWGLNDAFVCHPALKKAVLPGGVQNKPRAQVCSTISMNNTCKHNFRGLGMRFLRGSTQMGFVSSLWEETNDKPWQGQRDRFA